MVDILGPDRALDVHQDAGLRALELHHHDGGEVAALVPVREVVAREPAEWSVGHLEKNYLVLLLFILARWLYLLYFDFTTFTDGYKIRVF